MTDFVRWGIIGVAQIAKDQMAFAINAARGGALTAVATSSELEKAAPLQQFAPNIRAMQGYDALISDPDIDAVYIPLPNHLHVEWAIRAARAGKHVLCEKPIALELQDIDRLIAARQETGVELAEAWMIAHHPQWAKLRELIQSGAVGAVHRVDASFSAPLTDPTDFRNQRPGGGALRDLGPYVLGAARLATGQEPETVIDATIDWENGVDATVQATVRFPSFLLSAYMSMRGALWQDMTLTGADASLRLPVPFNPLGLGEARVEVHAEQSMQQWRYPEENQYVMQVEAFNQAIRKERDFPCPLEYVRGTQKLVDAVYDAALPDAP